MRSISGKVCHLPEPIGHSNKKSLLRNSATSRSASTAKMRRPAAGSCPRASISHCVRAGELYSHFAIQSPTRRLGQQEEGGALGSGQGTRECALGVLHQFFECRQALSTSAPSTPRR